MKVLIAVEGSKFSKNALEKAIEIFGGRKDNELLVVTAVELIVPPIEPFAVSAEYIQRIDDDAREAGKALLEETMGSLSDQHADLPATVTSKLLTGHAAQVIVEEAEEWGADVIVLGSHGYGFWRRAMLGSVSNSVLHHATCSVLIIRSSETVV